MCKNKEKFHNYDILIIENEIVTNANTKVVTNDNYEEKNYERK